MTDNNKLMHPEEAQEERKLLADVVLEADAVTQPSYAPVFVVFSGASYDKKDEIKSLGGRWSGDEARFGVVPAKRWYIRTTPAEIDDLAGRVAAIADIQSYPDQTDLDMAGELVKYVPKPGRYTKDGFDDDIKELWPDDDAVWNGKVYGDVGRQSIYLNGERVSVTDDQAQRMLSAVQADAAAAG